MSDSRLGLQIRLSALVALRPALTSAFSIALMIPFAGFINLIFHHRFGVDWKLGALFVALFGCLWFCATFVSTLLDLRRSDARELKSDPVFPASSFYSGLYGVAVVFSIVLIVGMYREHDPVWVVLTPILFLALAFYGWPRPIRCTEIGLSQRTSWGFRKFIPYSEIITVATADDGTTTVLGERETIEHTSCHADSWLFVETVEIRRKKARQIAKSRGQG